MPSTRNDAINYVEKSDMDDRDKAYWRKQQNPFLPELVKTLPSHASEFTITDHAFKTTDPDIPGVNGRLYTKTNHAKTSLLVVIPGGPTKSGFNRDADFAAQFGTDFIIFDVPPLKKDKRNAKKRYDGLADAFRAFLDSGFDKPYKEHKLIAASAGCFDGILLAIFEALRYRPFTAFAAIVPVTNWRLTLEDVGGKKHAPGLGFDRMSEFCKLATQKPKSFDRSVPQNLYSLPEKSIGRLPNMLFVIAEHDVLRSSGLEFARRVRKETTNNVIIALANGPHQVKDSGHFAAHDAVTSCIRKFLAGEKIDFDPASNLLRDVSDEK